jgi:hypothetical protein
MIQFRRGKTSSWFKQKKPLAAGQPGYDKDKHKIKIGDGEKSWDELPYASGLSSEEILSSEDEAKLRRRAALILNPLGGLIDSPAVITYGTKSPDKNTVGQLYLQTVDSEPEADYIVAHGIDGIWTYRKWQSGLAECWGSVDITTDMQSEYEDLPIYYDSAAVKAIKYPITFKNAPTELTSIQSPAGVAWLAGRSQNSNTKTGTYNILSLDKLTNATYTITFDIKGRWR